jgi:hypothetical protein
MIDNNNKLRQKQLTMLEQLHDKYLESVEKIVNDEEAVDNINEMIGHYTNKTEKAKDDDNDNEDFNFSRINAKHFEFDYGSDINNTMIRDIQSRLNIKFKNKHIKYMGDGVFNVLLEERKNIYSQKNFAVSDRIPIIKTMKTSNFSKASHETPSIIIGALESFF